MKIFPKIGLIMTLILLMVACDKQNDKDDLSFDVISENHPDTDQPYSIINTFDLYASYFKKVRDDAEQEEIEQLYKDEVIDPIYESCFADGEYIHMVDF